jgi:serine/threonine protein kinase
MARNPGWRAQEADESTELREARRSNRLQRQPPLTRRGRSAPKPVGAAAAIGRMHPDWFIDDLGSGAPAQAHGLIHRDIKPSNIIFASSVPKLADIGLMTHVSGQVLCRHGRIHSAGRAGQCPGRSL